MAVRVLISAGEASGDLYAAALATALRRQHPNIQLFGCTGPRMRQAGVETVVDSASLAVAGLVEVVRHIPSIYREYRKLLRACEDRRPELAILTDSPDFHLRVARQLKKMGIPVIYLVAPQVWAWRKRRLRLLRRVVDRLLCIFPFEERFFKERGVPVTYIGHPLTRLVRSAKSRTEVRARFGVPPDAPLVALLPGSRRGEIERHLPELSSAMRLIHQELPETRFVLALPPGTNFRERFGASSIQIFRACTGLNLHVAEGETWDVLAGSDVALAASGTVTIEACLLRTPMVTFYRVNRLSWLLGRFLVRVPFYTMVNLVAGRLVVPELIQDNLKGERLASEALRLLRDPSANDRMRRELDTVAGMLTGPEDPMEQAASIISRYLDKEFVHAS